MTDSELQEFVRRANDVYETKLGPLLEAEHAGEFIAIDPHSGNYVMGSTWREACRAARQAFPGRLTHVMGIGQRAALHLGWADR